MVKNISTGLKAHLQSDTTTITTCWKITRLDEQVFCYTELDRDLVIDGLTYKSTGGFNKSALKADGSLNVDNTEVQGFLSDDTIPDVEMRNGAFDYAKVEIFLVNYEDLAMGILKLRTGYFGEVKTVPSGAFLVELRGLVQLLSQTIGEIYVPECRTDFGSPQCGIVLHPNEWQANRTYVDGSRVIAPVDAVGYIAPAEIIMPNYDFETGDATGWSSASPGSSTISAGDFNLMPFSGTYYLLNYGIPYYRTHTFTTTEITGELVDSGDVWLDISFYGASYEYKSAPRVILTYYDEMDVTVEPPYEYAPGRPPSTREWHKYEFSVQPPVGARKVTISIESYAQGDFAVEGFGFDNVFAQARVVQDTPSWDVYGGVEFECTTTGTSGGTMPAFDTTLGNTTADNTTEWVAVRPTYTFLGTVNADMTVANGFTATGNFDQVATGWFTWGWVEWLDGPNAGARMEVSLFTNGAGIGAFKLAMPMARASLVGDKFKVTAGCDGRRVTCVNKFSNILNFRGEPDIPGNGEYFKIAGTGGGGL